MKNGTSINVKEEDKKNKTKDDDNKEKSGVE
jgi:hypothetical protein